MGTSNSPFAKESLVQVGLGFVILRQDEPGWITVLRS